MLSRVADAIYWMNRYLERAENYARFLDVNFNLSLELPPDFSAQWKPLVDTTGDWPLYESLYGKVEKNKVIYFLAFDEKNPNSIFNSLRNVRENARSVRPDITKEVWEQINYLYYFIKEEKSKKRWQKKDPTMMAGILGESGDLSNEPIKLRAFWMSNTICCCPKRKWWVRHLI